MPRYEDLDPDSKAFFRNFICREDGPPRGFRFPRRHAPAKTPPQLIAKLHQDVSAVLALPEVREQLASQGLALQTGSPEQLGALVRSDLARWRKVISEARIAAD